MIILFIIIGILLIRFIAWVFCHLITDFNVPGGHYDLYEVFGIIPFYRCQEEDILFTYFPIIMLIYLIIRINYLNFRRLLNFFKR